MLRIAIIIVALQTAAPGPCNCFVGDPNIIETVQV